MNPVYTYIANLPKQISEIPQDSIVSRTIYSDEQTKTILFAFATGQELSEHTSTQIAALYFIQGEADISQQTKLAGSVARKRAQRTVCQPASVSTRKACAFGPDTRRAT